MALNLNLTNKTAIITGGSMGIGWETAKKMVTEGMNILLTSRNEKILNSRAKELEKYESQLRVFPADLSKKDSAEKIASFCISEFNKIDILINSAGSAKGGNFLEIIDKDWEDAFNLKFFGSLRMIRSVIPYMKQQNNGKIVNIVGDTGKAPNSLMLPGSTVNAALLSLTKGLSNEVGKNGIRINAVNPGPTKTDRILKMFKQLAESSQKDINQIENEFLKDSVFKKLADPKEIADLILYLSSDVSSNITGTVITSDGGKSKNI